MAPVLLLIVEFCAVVTAVIGVWLLSPPAAFIVFGVLMVIIIERFSATTGRKQ